MQKGLVQDWTSLSIRLVKMDNLALDVISSDLRKQIESTVKKKYGWNTKEFESATLEFLKFLSLALSAPPSFIPVSEEIDEIWHVCILQTQEYSELCNKISPANFLHHKSERYENYAEGIATEHLIEESVSWTVNYILRFGDFTPSAIKHWLFPNHLQSKLGWKIEEINALSRFNDDLGPEN